MRNGLKQFNVETKTIVMPVRRVQVHVQVLFKFSITHTYADERGRAGIYAWYLSHRPIYSPLPMHANPIILFFVNFSPNIAAPNNAINNTSLPRTIGIMLEMSYLLLRSYISNDDATVMTADSNASKINHWLIHLLVCHHIRFCKICHRQKNGTAQYVTYDGIFVTC